MISSIKKKIGLSLDLNFNGLKRVIVALQMGDRAILPPSESIGISKKLPEPQKEGKKYNEWTFCTRELSEEKVVNVN